MKILICEDEVPAQNQLQKFILQTFEGAEIEAITETGEEALRIIQKNELDLIFMDVELADGSCFDTLDTVELEVPIIFTTAYDEYALKAFSLNSIDYLVKPISVHDVQKAYHKYLSLKKSFDVVPTFTFSRELSSGELYKERFLVKLGRKLFPLETNDIAYFMSLQKMVWLVTKSRKRYVINYTLTELENLLDPQKFYRLNRQFITSAEAVKELESYFKGQVTVELFPPVDEKIVISRTRTPELKKWLGL